MVSWQPRARAVVACALVTLGVSAGCGEWTPPAPSAPGLPSSDTPDTPSSGATLTGLVRLKGGGGLTAASVGNATVSQVRVSVVGTSITSPVDASGRFTLRGISTGSVLLQFSGPGIEATLRVNSIDDRETVDLAIELETRYARVEASVRIKVDSTTEIEGPVSRVSGTCPNLSAVVHGWNLNLSGTTQGGCADVRIGIRIKIRGNRSGNVIVVVKVEVRGASSDDDHDDDDDDHDDDDDDHDDD